MPALRQFGMPDAKIAELQPPLDGPNADALDAWIAMGGWFPERLGAVVELLGLVHVDGLMDRLMTIREALNESSDD